jgi:hypothetical protein
MERWMMRTKFDVNFPSFGKCNIPDYKIDSMTDEFFYSERFVLENSIDKEIYNKRMRLITMRVLTKEHTFWEVKDTNYMMKVLNGEMDDE